MPLTVQWVHEAVLDPPPQRRYLIEGLIREGELVGFAGPRGLGKSRFVFNLAGSLALGEGSLFLGRLPAGRRARTLILQGELDPPASVERWRMLLGTEDVPDGIAESFDQSVRLRVVEVRQSAPGIDGHDRTETWWEGQLDSRVEETIVEHGIDLLVVDPWATFFAGNENSNDQVEAALSQLRGLALRHGTAVVVVHHIGKANDVRDPEDLWRGASRLADWASTRITMVRHYSAKEATDLCLTAQQARQYVDLHFLRRHEPLDDFSAFIDDDGVFLPWDPEDGAAAFSGRLTDRDVAQAVATMGGFDSLADAARALGVSIRRAREALDRAVAAGTVIEAGDGSRRSWRLGGWTGQ